MSCVIFIGLCTLCYRKIYVFDWFDWLLIRFLTKKTNWEIVTFTTRFYVPLWYFYPFTTFALCWGTYVRSCNVILFFDYVPSLFQDVLYCLNWLLLIKTIITWLYHKNRKLEKWPFFQICLNFPKKLALFEKNLLVWWLHPNER